MPYTIKLPKPAICMLTGALCVALIAAIYWTGLSGGFFFDDSANILEPAGIQVKTLSLELLLDAWQSGIAGPLGRPVSLLSFAANYYFSGFDPFVFKLTNLAIHCLNGILVYFLAGMFLRAASPSDHIPKARVLAAAIAVLWAIHPIQMTSVLYVVQRMTSLASMFTLLALISHVWARQRKSPGRLELVSFAAAWGVFFPLSVLSKETGVVFLLYVAAYEAVLHRSYINRFDRFGSWYPKLLIAASALSLVYLFSPATGFLQGYDTRPFTLSQRLLTETRIIWEYIKLIVMPALPDFGLYHDDISLSSGLFSPSTTFFSIIGLCTLGTISWATRTKWPLVSFGILWFLIGHSLESSIPPLELMHEHRNYLPSLGIFIVVISVLQASATRAPIFKILAHGVVLVFAIYSGLLSHLRADMYENDFRRTQIESQYRMDSVRTQYEAGAVLVNMYNNQRDPMLYAIADKHFERVNTLDPAYKLALIGMLQLDCLSGNPTRIEVFDQLKERLQEHKWIPLDRTVMHGISEMSNAGTICLDRQQIDALFAAALGNRSTSVIDRSVISSDYAAYLWLGQKDYAAARDALVRAKNENPDDILNRINLLQLMRLLGDRKEAIAMLNDLGSRKLNRYDRKFLQAVKRELVTEGALAN